MAEGQTVLACGYRNSSDRMVIVRCVTPDGFFLERVVFPFELLSFECPAAGELEIWTHGLGGPELLETIPAQTLVLESAPASDVPSPWSAPQDHDLSDPLASWAAAG